VIAAPITIRFPSAVMRLPSGRGSSAVSSRTARRSAHMPTMPLRNIARHIPGNDGTPTTALTRPISDLQAELTEIGEREGAQVRVAPLMEARLTGGGFRITALTTAAKHLTSGR
jgi:hypothetical protein